MEGSIVQAEILRRRAAEHRARWEAMKREEREAEARVRDDAAVAEALRRARTLTSPTHTPTTSEIPNVDFRAEGEERQCRICFAGPERGMLFSPCRCNGSMRFVHVECLNNWRNMSRNPRSFYGCDQCGYQYNLERTRAAQWLEREELATFFAVLGIIALTVVVALLCRLASHCLYVTCSRLHDLIKTRAATSGWADRMTKRLASLTLPSVTTKRGVMFHTSLLYVEVLFYWLVHWNPPWRVMRGEGWLHSKYVVPFHTYFELLTGGFLALGLISFGVKMYQKVRRDGRQMFEYVVPSLAYLFLSHGTKGLRLPLFAGCLYAYLKLHDFAKKKSRELLMKIGERVLEVQL